GTATITVNIDVIGVNDPPENVDAGGPYTITEGGSVTLTGTATDPETAPGDLTYTWTITGGNAPIVLTTSSPTLTWAALEAVGVDGPTTLNVSLTVADGPAGDPNTNTATDTATINVTNAPPDLFLDLAPSTGGRGTPIVVSFFIDDPSLIDDQQGLTYTIDWGDGPDTVDTVSDPAGGPFFVEATHVYSNEGTFEITITVQDPDG